VDEIKKFITEMRQEGLSDEIIFNNLIKAGWDESQVSQAFLPENTTVPKPPSAENKKEQLDSDSTPAPVKTPKPSTNRNFDIESVLHNIFLWVFSIALITTLQISISYILRSKSDDEYFWKTLATSLASLIITGVAYGFFYWRLLKRIKADPTTNLKSRSTTVTIVLASLTLISTLIWLVSVLIWKIDLEMIIRLIIVIIYAVVVLFNYTQLNFGKPDSKLRLNFIKRFYFISLLGITIGSLAFPTITYINRRPDIQTKEQVVKLAKSIYNFYDSRKRLPDNLSEVNQAELKNITYRNVTNSSNKSFLDYLELGKAPKFEICANFKGADSDSGSYSYDHRSYDDNVITVYSENSIQEYSIKPGRAGENCFTFEIR
jgi:hypothetical protein